VTATLSVVALVVVACCLASHPSWYIVHFRLVQTAMTATARSCRAAADADPLARRRRLAKAGASEPYSVAKGCR
jgi:hypothetical protein